jgi:hypothetical protein
MKLSRDRSLGFHSDHHLYADYRHLWSTVACKHQCTEVFLLILKRTVTDIAYAKFTLQSVTQCLLYSCWMVWIVWLCYKVTNWYINTMTVFLHIICCPIFIQKKNFRRLDSSSTRWNLLTWVQSAQLVPVSGHQHQHKIEYKPTTTQYIPVEVRKLQLHPVYIKWEICVGSKKLCL